MDCFLHIIQFRSSVYILKTSACQGNVGPLSLFFPANTDGVLSITHLRRKWSTWPINSALLSISWVSKALVWTRRHNREILPTAAALVINSPTLHLQHRKSPITWPFWSIIPRWAFSLSISQGVNIGCVTKNWHWKLGLLTGVTAPTGVFVLLYNAVMRWWECRDEENSPTWDTSVLLPCSWQDVW